MRWGRWGQPIANAAPSPPLTPTSTVLSLLRQTPPPLWQLTLVLFLQAIVIHIYKEHFQGWKFSGGLCTNAFLQKQSCSRCLHLFPPFFWFLSFSFLSCLSFFFSFFSPRSCCLYCAYFSEYLKKPDIGDCSLIYTMFHWAGRENTHMAECAG